MDSSLDLSRPSIEDLSRNSSYKRGDFSISEISDFSKLRISALKNAADISPSVKEVTIGPNSPKKNYDFEDIVTEPIKDKNEENLIEDTVREDLRYFLISKQCDRQVHELSVELFNNNLDNMFIKRAGSIKQLWHKQRTEYDKRASDFRKRYLSILKALQDNDNLLLLEKARVDEQNSPEIYTQTIENMNRVLEEHNRATARSAALAHSHTKICDIVSDISLLTEPLAMTIRDKYKTNIMSISANIEHIMNICKPETVTDKDVKQAEILVANIENIKKKILDEIEVIKNEEVLKIQLAEEELRRKVIEEKKAQELRAAQIKQEEKVKSDQAKQIKPVYYSIKNYSYYEELRNYLDHYEAQYKDLLQDVSLKKFRFDCQKAVNTPVNALSSVSAIHMRDKYEKLSKLLRGERVQVLDIYVTATQHPQGLAYCTALLAKKIVRQGDLLVSSNVEAAYPLAAVTVALWSQFPEFGRLVEAYFHRFCPYLVPMYLPQKEGQTDKEFYLSRGYTYNDEGVVEKQDKFLKRMSGIFRLRCAIWVAQMPKFLNTPSPHGLSYGWRWLASFINLRPEPDISATLLNDFFIMCGSKFDKYYSRQFRKVLELTCVQYLKILENIDEGGPKTRLEVYLQNVLKTNAVPPPPASTQQVNW